MRAAPLACAWCALVATAAIAQEASPTPWEFRAEAQHDNLDHGQPDWSEELLQLAWKPRRGLAILGGARATGRFDQRDREGFAAGYLPLTPTTTLHIEGSASGTHHVLARDSGLAEVAQELGGGWVASIGGKLARYDTGDVRIGSLTIEKYLGDWRLAYTGYLSRADDGGWAPAHRLAATWYRDTLTFVTASVATGREVENVLPQGLVSTDVRAYALGGGLGLGRAWGLSLDAGHVRQGDLYTRRYARLGLRVLF